jgi:hypothetical protein
MTGMHRRSAEMNKVPKRGSFLGAKLPEAAPGCADHFPSAKALTLDYRETGSTRFNRIP